MLVKNSAARGPLLVKINSQAIVRPSSSVLINVLDSARKQFGPVVGGQFQSCCRCVVNIPGHSTIWMGSQIPKDRFDELIVGGNSHVE